MGSPRYLLEYAEYLIEVGEIAFLREFGVPALVGTTVSGRLAADKEDERRTHRKTGDDEVTPERGFRDRVWLIRKSPGAEHDKYVVIGQKAGCDIVVPEYTLSSRHAAFTSDPLATLKVADLGSLNGTKLDGRRLQSRQITKVPDGCTVVMGRIGFQCFTRDGFMDCLRSFER